MTYFRNGRIYVTLGVFAASWVAVPDVFADDIIPNVAASAQCARYGQGFVDLGNGLCGRNSRHLRVYGGSNRIEAPVQRVDSWTTNGTASAALRSDGMLSGAEATHLRVRGGLDTFSPFR